MYTIRSAQTCIARRCTAGRFIPPGRGIALRLKTRSSDSPTSRRTRSSSSRRAATRSRSTATAFQRACLAMCRTKSSGRSVAGAQSLHAVAAGDFDLGAVAGRLRRGAAAGRGARRASHRHCRGLGVLDRRESRLRAPEPHRALAGGGRRARCRDPRLLGRDVPARDDHRRDRESRADAGARRQFRRDGAGCSGTLL